MNEKQSCYKTKQILFGYIHTAACLYFETSSRFFFDVLTLLPIITKVKVAISMKYLTICGF